MSPVTHQTITLGKGKHRSPDEGACVMELASMLADEPFSDHPISVCPVIGSFLRAYNDFVDDERRQDLYAYAAHVVGSRGSAEVQAARAERLAAWAEARQPRRRRPAFFPLALPTLGPKPANDTLGTRAVRTIAAHDDSSHGAALALVDELLAMDQLSDGASTVWGRSGSAPVRLVSR